MKRVGALSTFALIATLAGASVAIAGPLETVSLPGGGGTHTDLAAAIAAVDNGGVVEIIQAGDYSPVSPALAFNLSAGPATYTIRKAASVVGVVRITSGSNGVFTLNGIGTEVTTNKNITIEGVTVERTGGTGAAIDIDQSNPAAAAPSNTATITFTLNDCIVRHTGPTNGDTGEAIKLDDGYAGGALVTFTANNCTFSATGEGASQKSTLRVQDATWENLNVVLNNCIISNPGYRTIRNDALSTQSWLIDGCTISGPTGAVADTYGRVIAFPANVSNMVFTMTDTTVTGKEELIIMGGSSSTGVNNSVTIERCTFDNSIASTDAVVDVRFANPSTPKNNLKVTNSVFVIGNASAQRCLNLQGFDSSDAAKGGFIYNNTFVALGASGATAAIGGTGLGLNVWNNVALNFNGGDNIFGGSYADQGTTNTRNSGNNFIVGASNDTTPPGSSTVYLTAVAGLSNALTAAGLDSSYKPLAGSPLLGAGAITVAGTVNHTNTNILAYIGNVDRDGNPRQSPPDVGAYELVDPTSVNDWTMFE